MSDASTRLGAALALAAVLLAAVVVRAWGISAGLPYIRHPDEPVSITTMREMITRGVPIPDRFDYSSLSYYVNAAAYVPYLWLTGGVHRPSSELLPSVAAMGVARDPDPGATLLSRIITLLFGVATVGLAYALARRLGLGSLASAGAAAAVALNPDHVFHSRFVAPDVIATFFATATVLAAVGIAKKGTWRDYLLAGVLTGLAAGTKYNAGLVFIAVAAAHVARLDLRSPFRPRDLLFLIGAAAAAAAAFLLSTPALIVEPGTVVGAVLGIGRTYGTGHPGQDGGQVVWYARNIWVTFGPLALFFAASAWSAMRRKDRVLAAAMVFPVVYLVFLCLFTVRNERVMLPVVPVFAVISVAGAFMSADLVPSGAPARWARTAAPAVLAALLVVPAARAFACSRSYAGPQAQAEARQWIDANLPRDARIVVENYGPYVFDTHPGATATDYLGHASADAYRDEGVEYLVASKDAFGRFYTDPGSSAVYLTARDNYESFRKEFRALATFTDATQHGVIVYAVSP